MVAGEIAEAHTTLRDAVNKKLEEHKEWLADVAANVSGSAEHALRKYVRDVVKLEVRAVIASLGGGA
jgi:hypothetical protein